METVLDYIAEILIGIALLVGCYLLLGLFVWFNKLCAEGSKRGKIARKIGKTGGAFFWGYLGILAIGGIIGGIVMFFIWLFN